MKKLVFTNFSGIAKPGKEYENTKIAPSNTGYVEAFCNSNAIDTIQVPGVLTVGGGAGTELTNGSVVSANIQRFVSYTR